MSEPSESRAEELEQRLQDQPGSRLFVQLAEEYRRLERYDDAIRTLEKGLEDQPTYVSARVLLGRCRLESGDAAGAIPELEQVLKQDQTHLLAHKLLTEAHLETGEYAAARQRLEQYQMLNESDPEIGELRARLAGGEAPADPQPVPSVPEPPEVPPEVPMETMETPEALADEEEEPSDEDLFDLGAPSPAAPAAEDEDLLGVWEAEPEPEVERPEPEPVLESAQEPPSAEGEDPFGDLWSPDDRQRLEEDFALGLFAEAEGAEPEVTEEPEEPEEPEERATVTLGRLYLQQGHHDEARRIFREVLDREPNHAEARAELLRLDSEPEPDLEVAPAAPEPGVAAPEPEDVPEPAPEPGVASPEPLTAADLEDPGARSLGLTERKIRILDNYLRQIRRSAEQHVR